MISTDTCACGKDNDDMQQLGMINSTQAMVTYSGGHNLLSRGCSTVRGSWLGVSSLPGIFFFDGQAVCNGHICH